MAMLLPLTGELVIVDIASISGFLFSQALKLQRCYHTWLHALSFSFHYFDISLMMRISVSLVVVTLRAMIPLPSSLISQAQSSHSLSPLILMHHLILVGVTFIHYLVLKPSLSRLKVNRNLGLHKLSFFCCFQFLYSLWSCWVDDGIKSVTLRYSITQIWFL